MTDFDIRDHLKPGDMVVVGQATAEPPDLVGRLIAAAQDVSELVALCGYSLTDAWNEVTASGPRVRTYFSHCAFRKLGDRGLLEVLPWHLSVFESYITSGRLK